MPGLPALSREEEQTQEIKETHPEGCVSTLINSFVMSQDTKQVYRKGKHFFLKYNNLELNSWIFLVNALLGHYLCTLVVVL